MALVKLPEPVPSEVFELSTVGFVEVLQQTPRAVTAAPPSLVILPPLVAVVEVRDEIAVVVKTGKIAVAVTVTSYP